jgi:hypothetical protein
VKSYKFIRSDGPFNTYAVVDRATGAVLGAVTGWSERSWSAKDEVGNVLFPCGPRRPDSPQTVSQRRGYFSLRKHAAERVVREARK